MNVKFADNNNDEKGQYVFWLYGFSPHVVENNIGAMTVRGFSPHVVENNISLLTVHGFLPRLVGENNMGA